VNIELNPVSLIIHVYKQMHMYIYFVTIYIQLIMT